MKILIENFYQKTQNDLVYEKVTLFQTQKLSLKKKLKKTDTVKIYFTEESDIYSDKFSKINFFTNFNFINFIMQAIRNYDHFKNEFFWLCYFEAGLKNQLFC